MPSAVRCPVPLEPFRCHSHASTTRLHLARDICKITVPRASTLIIRAPTATNMLRAIAPRALGVFFASSVAVGLADNQAADIAPPTKAKKANPWKNKTNHVEKEADPDLAIISGTASRELSEKICLSMGRKLSDVEINKFSDGEININIKESMRGKDVYVIQTCSPPVNENVMELLLSVAAAKRSGATTVTAVIPYFPYKLNRRGLPISTTHHSRFLWNAAGDVAKMLQVLGVDKVISVDLQRAGQGQEACFFKASLPAETISTNDLFVDYFSRTLENHPVVIVSPNTEYTKKARKFQKKLAALRPGLAVDNAVFLRSDTESVVEKGVTLEVQGDVKGKDVVLIEDYIDSAVHMTTLANRLLREGARKVFVCASHGHFDSSAMRLLDLSPISQLVISDSIGLPSHSTQKIVQVSIAKLLATVISSDIRSGMFEFNQDNTDEDFVQE